MTLKVNWKRTNRGLWLAGIAIIIVAINIIIDNYQFTNEKEDIINVVYDFSKVVADVIDSPDKVITNNGKWDDATLEAEEKEIYDAYNKYWTTKSAETYLESFVNMMDFKEDIKLMLNDMENNNGYVRRLEIELGTATVKAYGPNGAAVTVDANIKMTTSRVDTLVYGIGSEYGMMYYEENMYGDDYMDIVVSGKEEGEEMESGENEFNYSEEITFVLLRENGEWKISGITYF